MGGDDYLAKIDPDELIEYYYKQYSLPELVLLDGGKPRFIQDKPSSKHSESGSARFIIRF